MKKEFSHLLCYVFHFFYILFAIFFVFHRFIEYGCTTNMFQAIRQSHTHCFGDWSLPDFAVPLETV